MKRYFTEVQPVFSDSYYSHIYIQNSYNKRYFTEVQAYVFQPDLLVLCFLSFCTCFCLSFCLSRWPFHPLIDLTKGIVREYRPRFCWPVSFFLSFFPSFFLSLSSPPIDRVPLKVGLHLYSMIVLSGLALALAKLQAWPASEFQPSILSNSSETGITYYPYYSKSLTKGIVREYRPRFCWPWPWRHDVRICREFQ